MEFALLWPTTWQIANSLFSMYTSEPQDLNIQVCMFVGLQFGPSNLCLHNISSVRYFLQIVWIMEIGMNLFSCPICNFGNMVLCFWWQALFPLTVFSSISLKVHGRVLTSKIWKIICRALSSKKHILLKVWSPGVWSEIIWVWNRGNFQINYCCGRLLKQSSMQQCQHGCVTHRNQMKF